MHVCVCVLALSHGEGMCVSSQRPPLCVCVRMYMNELVALQQFPGSEGAAFSEQHCMCSHTYIQRHTLTYSPIQRGLLGWKPSLFSLKTHSRFVQFVSLCCPVKDIF